MMAFRGLGRCSGSWKAGRKRFCFRGFKEVYLTSSFRLGRSKKVSGDYGGRSKALQMSDSPLRPQSGQSSVVPSVIVSKESPDDDDILTSGQVSPICALHVSPAQSDAELGSSRQPHT